MESCRAGYTKVKAYKMPAKSAHGVSTYCRKKPAQKPRSAPKRARESDGNNTQGAKQQRQG